MLFGELLDEIEKLKGMWLDPLGRARSVRVVEVDREHERLVLEVKGSGTKANRAFSELMKLLDALNARPAIHVDSILAGSGTSRNQPETVLANLPFIEVLYIERRKHLAMVATRSHKYGSVREMDSLAAKQVETELAAEAARPPVTGLISTTDLVTTVRTLSKALGMVARMIDEHTASLGEGTEKFWVVQSTDALPAGTYLVLDRASALASTHSFVLEHVQYDLVQSAAVPFLVRSR